MLESPRRIADKTHNKFLDELYEHQATQAAPPSLLQVFDEEHKRTIARRYSVLDAILREQLGEPFFSEDGFILYSGDCVDYLSRLAKSELRVNLTVTSPPYNIGKEYERQMSVSAYVEWCSEWMRLVHKVTKWDGSFWLNVGYFEVPTKGLGVPIAYLLWDKARFYLLQEIVWAYGAGVSARRRLSPRNEKWLFYVKNPEHYTFNLDDIRDPNVKYPNQKKNGRYRCNALGKNPSDVWDIPKVTTGTNRSSKERTSHPAQFPLGVVERIVKASSNVFDVVIDPFAGSCSVGIAATGLGRLFLGFEQRADYCQMAVKRFRGFMEERRRAEEQVALF
jgi:adenine-specific DNA-methyltransferase